MSEINERAMELSPGLVGGTVRDKLTREATLPLFILFCAIIALRFGMIVYNKFHNILTKVSKL
jgi:hypothetical protein